MSGHSRIGPPLPRSELGALGRALDARIGGLPGVELRRSRFSDAAAWYVGTCEFVHLHDDHEADVRLTRAVLRERREELRADTRVVWRASSSDWIEAKVRTSADVAWLADLAEAAYRANRQSGRKR